MKFKGRKIWGVCDRLLEIALFAARMGNIQEYVKGPHMGKRLTVGERGRNRRLKRKV